jgi:hypothetical protein
MAAEWTYLAGWGSAGKTKNHSAWTISMQRTDGAPDHAWDRSRAK